MGFVFQAVGALNAARSSRIRSFGAVGNPTTATLCFHYCHLMVQISHIRVCQRKEIWMRWAGRIRMGYFPLPLSEAERIRRFLLFLDQLSSALAVVYCESGSAEGI